MLAALVSPLNRETQYTTCTSKDLYRLTKATSAGAYSYTFGYAHDAVGNRTAQTATITSTVVTTYTYDAANQLLTAKANNDSTNGITVTMATATWWR